MNRSERVSIIQAIFFCEAPEAEKLCEVLHWSKAEPADTIAFQGDEANHCQFVVSGAVGLHALGSEGQYTQIATVEPGEVFGAYPDAATHLVEAVAQGTVELLVIGTAQLRELAQSHAAIASGRFGPACGPLVN